MKFNPIKAIIEVYQNIKNALTDPNSPLNLIGIELELRDEEQRMASKERMPQIRKECEATENVSPKRQSAELIAKATVKFPKLQNVENQHKKSLS
ncbi:MAG: hypothetical protein K2M12_02735 [Muribaculaceae bacterium]|nr:hypothetical protein [Muribaculaceae bacterium]